MGTYLNPGNSGFERIMNSGYVDKTGLIGLLNRTIDTTKNLTCISRPRRFGKSYAAQMLCAYYDKTCDSHELFDGLAISGDESYKKHLNKYDIIYIDMTNFVSAAKNSGRLPEMVPEELNKAVLKEVVLEYPELSGAYDLTDALLQMVNITGSRIIFIIDEWDALIREAQHDEETQKRFLNLLRAWFKNGNFTPKAVAAAYMTGILPIKKDGSQSAISDFREYSVLEPLEFAEYVGFTEEEVRQQCEQHQGNFEKMKHWYDGYTAGDQHSIYNPYSVMQALGSNKYKSYWKKTSAAETLMTYIDMDQDGLQDDIARLIAGESIVVDPDSFQNDVETFTCKDDVLTLLIHLGYLTYEEVNDSYGDGEDELLTGLARIPNEEVRSEFEKILRKAKHTSLIELVKRSDQLLKDTIAGNSEAVAKAIQDVHESDALACRGTVQWTVSSQYAPTWYNNEQALRYVVKMAYISSVDQYGKVEELPTGHGIADVVFVPKRRSSLPAMIVELKWDKSAEGAIRQIREKNYPKVLSQFTGDILLVGMNYDERTKEHTCRIEKLGR